MLWHSRPAMVGALPSISMHPTAGALVPPNSAMKTQSEIFCAIIKSFSEDTLSNRNAIFFQMVGGLHQAFACQRSPIATARRISCRTKSKRKKEDVRRVSSTLSIASLCLKGHLPLNIIRHCRDSRWKFRLLCLAVCRARIDCSRKR